MAKYDKMVAKFDLLTDPKQIQEAIDTLAEIRDALTEGMSHYADQEKLNNWHEPWYANARDSYEQKVAKTDAVILRLKGRLLASAPTI